MESLRRFNQLSYAKYLYTDGRIILVDVPLELCVKEKLGHLRTVDGKDLVFLETDQLARDLEQFLEAKQKWTQVKNFYLWSYKKHSYNV